MRWTCFAVAQLKYHLWPGHWNMLHNYCLQTGVCLVKVFPWKILINFKEGIRSPATWVLGVNIPYDYEQKCSKQHPLPCSFWNSGCLFRFSSEFGLWQLYTIKGACKVEFSFIYWCHIYSILVPSVRLSLMKSGLLFLKHQFLDPDVMSFQVLVLRLVQRIIKGGTVPVANIS